MRTSFIYQIRKSLFFWRNRPRQTAAAPGGEPLKGLTTRIVWLPGKPGVLFETNRHHLYSKHLFPFLANEPMNGILICRSIHLRFHKIYGQNVRVDNFIDFVDMLKREKNPIKEQRLEAVKDWLLFLKGEMENRYFPYLG